MAELEGSGRELEVYTYQGTGMVYATGTIVPVGFRLYIAPDMPDIKREMGVLLAELYIDRYMIDHKLDGGSDDDGTGTDNQS